MTVAFSRYGGIFYSFIFDSELDEYFQTTTHVSYYHFHFLYLTEKQQRQQRQSKSELESQFVMSESIAALPPAPLFGGLAY